MGKISSKQTKSSIFIDINLMPIWDHVANLRTFIEDYLNIEYKDKKKSNIIAFSISELLENSIKYSDGGAIHLIIKCDKKLKVEVTIENNANSEDIAELKKEIDELNNVTPEHAYENKLKSVFAEKTLDGGIGLAMIREKTKGEFYLKINGKKVQMECILEIK